MKRVVLTLILLLGVLAVRAGNTLSVTSASGHPQDEVTLNVSLANTNAAVAFQAEIPLGSQLTYVPGSVTLNPARVTDHQVTAAVVNGNLRIYVFSLSLTPFVGSQGNLLSFTLKLKNEPGVYPISLSNAILSSATSTALSLTTQNGQVTILSPKLQINTTTIDYGHVPIRSEYTQNANVINVGNEPLTITSITFNDPVFSCPNFTQKTLQPNGSANFAFKFAPMVKGAVTASATVISNSIAGNGVISLVADPFAVNEFHINNVTGYCDSIVEVPITMNNMESIIGFQIDMNLPQQLEYVDFTLSNRKTDHVSTGVFNEGVLRLMAYSPSGAAFTGDDGLIATLRLKLQGLYGNYYLNPFKAVLADANGENVLSAQYQGRITIRSPRINGNASLDMGSSPVTEEVTKEYVVNNNGNASMRIDQVVFDQTGFSVAESFPVIVQQYASTTLHVSCNRDQRGDFNTLMKIYSNDPQNGLKNVSLSGSRYEPNSISLAADPLGNGDVSVALSMDNYSDIVALQADFCYPFEAYSVGTSDFQLTARFDAHNLYAIPLNDSTFRILVLSMQNHPVEGHNGVVLNVTLHPIDTSEEGEHSVSVSNVVLSNVESENLFTGDVVTASFGLAIKQVVQLSQGWNWFSSYVECRAGLLTALEDNIAANNTTALIKNMSYSTMLQNGSWSESDLNFTNESMYMVQVANTTIVSLTGNPADPEAHPITLVPGWNWIGFISAEVMTLSEALADLTPTAGDLIKNMSGASTYNGSIWEGSLDNLEPGSGYMYNNGGEQKTLVYPAASKGVIISQPKEHYWNTNVHEHATNLVMMATLDENQFTMTDGNYEIGAFVDEECRGSALLQQTSNGYVAFFVIHGEAGEAIHFKLYDVMNAMEVGVAEEQITYVANAIIGSVEEPVVLHFRNTGIDVDANSLSIFPNPTMDKLYLQGASIQSVKVFNALGQLVLSRECNSAENVDLNLNVLGAGVYTVAVRLDNGSLVNKLVVKE